MKIRNDFVTNSSSSSFIVSKNDISKEQLIDILIELANLDRKYYSDDDDYEPVTREDDYHVESDNEFSVTYHYHVTDATVEKPFTEYDDDEIYDNHFIVDNQGCSRYDWGDICDVFDKYGIDFRYGYCD